jgi:mannosyltransferase OCH1-like enzyme
MDTVCNNTLPLHRLGSPKVKDYALFKSTHPTGITNDLLVASARHPIYASAISKLPAYNALTRSWARLQPYCAIMISAGPLFLTMVVKDYLLESSALHSKAAGVVNQTELAPYITDLQSNSWHRADAQMLMWIGERPWLWFTMGTFVLLAGLYVVDRLLLLFYSHFRKVPSDIYGTKLDKEA